MASDVSEDCDILALLLQPYSGLMFFGSYRGIVKAVLMTTGRNLMTCWEARQVGVLSAQNLTLPKNMSVQCCARKSP